MVIGDRTIFFSLILQLEETEAPVIADLGLMANENQSWN